MPFAPLLRSRSLAFALAGLLVAACEACSGGSTDPTLATPCAQRKGRSVVVGTGDLQFEPIAASGVLIETGPQGGNHIWIGFQCRGLGPKVTAEYGIRDTGTGEVLTLPGLHSAIELEYNGDTDATSGIYGYLDGRFVQDLPGRHVTLWATIDDACQVPTSGSTDAVVKGFR